MIKDSEEKFKINNLTADNLQELIQRCERKNNNWNLLNDTIETIFSNRSNLSNSFLKSEYSNNISKAEEISSSASATPKSKRCVCRY